MISPHTPPGTKVTQYLHPTFVGSDVAHEDTFGKPLTLVEIIPNPYTNSGYSALVEGYESRICLRLLRRLDLPESLTSILDKAPVLEDA